MTLYGSSRERASLSALSTLAAPPESTTKTAIPRRCYAEIAQLVEHQLPKLRVASSSLVFRSN